MSGVMVVFQLGKLPFADFLQAEGRLFKIVIADSDRPGVNRILTVELVDAFLILGAAAFLFIAQGR